MNPTKGTVGARCRPGRWRRCTGRTWRTGGGVLCGGVGAERARLTGSPCSDVRSDGAAYMYNYAIYII